MAEEIIGRLGDDPIYYDKDEKAEPIETPDYDGKNYYCGICGKKLLQKDRNGRTIPAILAQKKHWKNVRAFCQECKFPDSNVIKHDEMLSK